MSATNNFAKVIIIIAICAGMIAGIVFAVFGLILVEMGATGETEFTLFGHKFKSTSTGVTGIAIGAAIIIVTLVCAFKSVNLAIAQNIKKAAFGIKNPDVQIMKIAVAVVQKERHFLLVKRRLGQDNLRWQFPSRIIRINIPRDKVAIDAVEKETGITCDITRYLGNRLQPDTGVDAYYYLCKYISGQAENLDVEQNADVQWIDANEAIPLIQTDLFPPIEKILRKVK